MSQIIKFIAPDDSIRISWYIEKTDCLGPFDRFALWLQGCQKNCPGCISKENQPLHGGKLIKIKDLADKILASANTEGITISGGEPFYQADKLCRLLDIVKNKRPDYGIIVYTGFLLEQLQKSNEVMVLRLIEKYIDILIDGPYIQENDDDIGLRGSSNQRAITFSDRYKDEMDMYTNPSGRKSSVFLSNKKMQMVGIPSAVVKKMLDVN